MRRRWARSAALAVLAAALALVATPAPPGAAARVPTKHPGVLMVGLSMPVPNFQFGVVIGSEVVVAQGLEIDLVEEIARRLGVPRVEYVNETGFLPIIDGRPKPYDLAIAEATITPEREQRVDFSVPYMRADQGVLMARQYRSDPPRTLAEVRRLRLCSGRGTTGAMAIRDHVRPVQPPLLLENQRRVFDALRRGRCAAAVYDAPILAAVKAAKPEVYGRLIGRIPTDERYGIVFEQGSPLRRYVDPVITRLFEQRVLHRIRDRWIGTAAQRLPVLR
jgi:polar amino acid transport system substrate-binding protein